MWLSSLTYPDSQAFSYTYDAMSRPKTLVSPTSTAIVTWGIPGTGNSGDSREFRGQYTYLPFPSVPANLSKWPASRAS